MRKFALVMFACVVALAATAGAQAPDSQLMAPIQKFLDSFNKGDAVGAAATHAAEADLTIIDEVPPFIWRGPKAFQDWSTALESASKQAGLTDQTVTIKAPTRVESSADMAYVVVPATYAFTQKGKAMREVAQMTFVLKKGPGGWLIHGWTWTGPVAKPVPAAGKR